MHTHVFRCIKIYTLILLGTPVVSIAAAASELVVPRVTGVDDVAEYLESDAIDPRMARIEGLVQRTPDDGEPTAFPTTVHIAYDDRHLYLRFEAKDPSPSQIRAAMTRREAISADDAVRVYLDTFGDQQRAYVFRLNPLGVQWDATYSEANGWDVSFDAVWKSGGRLTENGFRCWMAIPWRSLRFPPIDGSERPWGLIVGREVARGDAEESYWPAVSNRIDGWLNQAALLRGLEGIEPGHSRRVIPFATHRNFELRDETTGELVAQDESTAGLDAKLVLADRFVVDATVEPDFSQVESDRPQITVNQRFEVFFPERRPFFLENADYFRSPISLLFTRRIADPSTGLRFTGKAGRTAIGALLIDDEAPGLRAEEGDPEHGRSATFGALRLERGLGRQSTSGLFYVSREIAGASNEALSADVRWKLDDHWVATGQLAQSRDRTRDGTERTGHALLAQVNRQGRRASYFGRYLDIADDFEVAAGFVPRTDLRQSTHFFSFWTWPEDSALIFWGPEIFVQQSWDQDGTLVDEQYEGSLEWHWSGSRFLELNLGTGSLTLRPQDHDGLPSRRRFSTSDVVLELGTSHSRRWQAQSNLWWRRTANLAPAGGSLPAAAEDLGGNLNLQLQATRNLRGDLLWLYTRLSDRELGREIFTNQILRLRLDLQVNRAFSLRLILSHDQLRRDPVLTSLDERETFNVDFLATYRLDPWTALYLGTNSNYRAFPVPGSFGTGGRSPVLGSAERDATQFFAKVSYRFDF
ncbi:MAG: carbohydrate binding family 9 domain-containing protein [Thermoanaerobaculia bacterium]|nr:carbohydrate binding family 9 domain-containing protein [Thermoanaerobaculia bacterium]